jgi:hypothetical protein
VFPIGGGADADFELADIGGDSGQESAIDVVGTAQVVAGGGVTEDAGGEAFFDSDSASAVFILIKGGVAAAFAP